MCLQHKAETSRRILFALEHLDRSGLLLVPLADAVIVFVEEELKAAGVDAGSCTRPTAAGAVAQDAGGAAEGAEVASCTLRLQDEQRKEQQQGQGVAATPAEVLALLPHLPLASLHRLLAFICLQLAWRLQGQQSVQDALQVCTARKIPARLPARPPACLAGVNQ